MINRTVITADIAKSVFQVVSFKNSQQVSPNKSYKRQQFEKLILNTPPSIWVMENCTGAQHWARLAQSKGHEVILLGPLFVSRFRQGQKTDANDAIAIYDAFNARQMKPCPLKSVEQQGLQALEKVRARYQSQRTAISNAMRGHLADFGIVFPKGYGSLKKQIPSILEDAENGLPTSARIALDCYWQDWQLSTERVKQLDHEIRRQLKTFSAAKELQKMEGIGPVGATGLICALGDGKQIKSAKEAGAFIGTSPKQYSSGGKEVVIGISKKSGHKALRSVLIQGARAVLLKMKRKGYPTSAREAWLASLVERIGENKAAVALANKNVRTAWAILAHGRTFEQTAYTN
jgi:transposase